MTSVATSSATRTKKTVAPTHQSGWTLRQPRRAGLGSGSPGTIGVRLSTLVICLVVAGTAIALVTKMVTGEGPKPATDGVGNERAKPATRSVQPSPRAVPGAPTSGMGTPTAFRRIRSALWLVVLLALVGALAALTVGALVLLVVGALRHAVG